MTGILRVVTPDEVSAQEAAQEAASTLGNQTSPVLDGLAKYVTDAFEAAKTARQSARMGSEKSVDDRLLDALRAKIGEYDPKTLSEIKKFGGSMVYARVTATKARTAAAWLKDILLSQNEKPWTLRPTPEPEPAEDLKQSISALMSSEVMEITARTGRPPSAEEIRTRAEDLIDQARQATMASAKVAAERMETRIHDQLTEGGFHRALSEFIDDLVLFPVAILKAPVIRKRRKLMWREGQPVVDDKFVYDVERVSPFNIWFAPDVSCPDEGYVVELHRMSKTDFEALKGVPGYSNDDIDAILNEWSQYDEWVNLWNTTEQEELEGRDMGTNIPEPSTIPVLEFHGAVSGKQLVEWGLDATEIPDPAKMYEACVWWVKDRVFKAQLNYDPRGKRPYYVTSFEKVPGSVYGNGLADILEDVQGVISAALRSLVNNMALSSGPMVGYNMDRLPTGADTQTIFPWKIFEFLSDPMGSTAPALEFFQPSNNSLAILQVVEKFLQLADDTSTIPRYMQGNERVGGAGRTASGLSMMLEAANKTLKQVLGNVDFDILSPVIESFFVYNMLTDPSLRSKQDIQIVARGALALAQKDALQLRRNEFLNATANPVDLQVVGIPGRAAILREVAKGLDMPIDEIVPKLGGGFGMQGPGQGPLPPGGSPGGSVAPPPVTPTTPFGQAPQRTRGGTGNPPQAGA